MLFSYLVKPSDANINVEQEDSEPLSFHLSEDLLHEAEFALFQWAIGARSSADINGLFSAVCGEQWAIMTSPGLSEWHPTARRAWLSDLRWRAFGSFDTLRLRLAVTSMLLRQIEGHADAIRNMKALGFGREEALLYVELLADDNARRAAFNGLEPLMDPKVKADFTLDPKVIALQMVEDFESRKMAAAARAKVHRLRVFAKHNRFDRDDMANEVLSRAVGYYYLSRPFKTRLHAQNMAKSAMDGRVSQLIKYYTNPDRARIVKDGVGSSVVVLSLQDFDVGDNSEIKNEDDQSGFQDEGYDDVEDVVSAA